MVKKIFAVVLILCFLSLTLAPNFVYAETEDEKQARKDASAGRLLVILGILALAGHLLGGPDKFADETTKETGVGFGLGFTTHDEMFVPGFVLAVHW